MAIGQEELGRRLRIARESCRMTQADVGRHLSLSPAAIAEIERGDRPAEVLQLQGLAHLFGRELGEFVAEEFPLPSPLPEILQAEPGLLRHAEAMESLRSCLKLCRELTNLERFMGIDRGFPASVTYDCGVPRCQSEAIRQGRSVADQERQRLGLGLAPVPNIDDLLTAHGVRVSAVPMPVELAGISVRDARVGYLAVTNAGHSLQQRRFTWARLYALLLLDRDRPATVSRSTSGHEPAESRATAFAEAFLMPGPSVRHLLAALGKEQTHCDGFRPSDDDRPSEDPTCPDAAEVQLHDILSVARHFGVSPGVALDRLESLRVLDESKVAHWNTQLEAKHGVLLARVLDLDEESPRAGRDPLRPRLLTLALEALRRDEITRRKFVELARMVSLSDEQRDELLLGSGWFPEDEVGDLLLTHA